MRYKIRDPRYQNGSALILAVVLTSLLAIVGVLFLLTSRVDKMATSAISENRGLNMAIDAVIAQIEQELVLDVPGNPNNPGQEHYDYPDVNNTWLAALEPYEGQGVGQGDYKWRPTDLSDIYRFGLSGFAPQAVVIFPEYQDPATIGHSSGIGLYLGDADGDGVADSVWVELPEVTTSKGWPIYAAVRVIDNSAMLNVNTAYKFDPCEVLQENIDGSSQMQINLMALAQPGGTLPAPGQDTDLLDARANYGVGVTPVNLDAYDVNVVWRYGEPNGPYTPFDISDELELRNRFVVNHDDIDSRLEGLGIGGAGSWGFRTINDFRRPVEPGELDEWFITAYAGAGFDPNYAYRHIATTCNMDRIIGPDGRKMLNVNALVPTDETLRIIREALLAANPYFVDVSAAAAQMAANLIDFRDDNEIVTPVVDDVEGETYYGFERPCIYISELVYKSGGPDIRSYAVELYKPYFEDNDPCDWRLVIDNTAASPPNDVYVPIIWSGTRQFHVIEWQDPNALLSVGFLDPNSPNPVDGAMWVDPKVIFSWPVRPRALSYDLYLGTGFEDVNSADNTSDEWIVNQSDNKYPIIGYDANGLQPETTYYWRVDDVNGPDTWKGEVWTFTTAPSGSGYSSPAAQAAGGWAPGIPVFDVGSIINLQRFVPDMGEYITVDSSPVPDWLVAGAGTRSFQRDITRHKCIRRLWDLSDKNPTLGYSNSFENRTDPNIMIQAHPENADFVGIGDIGKVFAVDAYWIGPSDLEEDIRINLADPNYQPILNYLTVFDPTKYGSVPDETRIKGRININTAPWYVIAQLPWMTPEIAQAIVAYRDKLKLLSRLVDYSQEPTGRGTGMVDADLVLPHYPPAIVREAPGFASVAELVNVTHDLAGQGGIRYEPFYDIRTYGRDTAVDQREFPDLTPEDGAADDLEERDLVFARISNLVTVRSDVFTAYILVRIGTDGPQKRVIAILDRSNVYYDSVMKKTVGEVKVVALHPVPDAR